jgi:protein-tyrosine-phosphatase
MTHTQNTRQRLLFVCTGNTCRSVLAEHIARSQFLLDASSAGIDPQPSSDAAGAIETLNELGIDASRHVTRGLDAVNISVVDHVVAMEPYIATVVEQTFPDFPTTSMTIWNIADPWGYSSAYKSCAEEIVVQLKRFLKTYDSFQRL